MKKILIIGAGVEQVPAIKEAKEMGLFIVSTDMNLKAPGIKFADIAYEASTDDAYKNIEIAKKEKIDGVMTVSSETAVTTVANVASAMNLPCFSPDTALKATNKAEMRKSLINSKIKVSPFALVKTYNELLTFSKSVEGPWVIKPIDSSGQRGISFINDFSGLKNAFNTAIKFSKSKEVMIDKFLEGTEIHVTMQVVNSKINYLAISDRITLDKKNFGIAVRHIGPSLLKESILQKIKSLCGESVKAVGLKNGVATCEIILQENEPILIEIAVRTPGGYLRNVAMHLSGVDIIKSTIFNCLGQNKELSELVTEDVFPSVSVKFITRANIPLSENRIYSLENIEDVRNLDGIKLCKFHFDGEFDIPPLSSSTGRFGAIIGVGKTRREALETTEKAFNLIKVNNKSLIEYTNYNSNNPSFI